MSNQTPVRKAVFPGKCRCKRDFSDSRLCADVVFWFFRLHFRELSDDPYLAGQRSPGSGTFAAFGLAVHENRDAKETGASLVFSAAYKWRLLPGIVNGNHAFAAGDGDFCSDGSRSLS